MKINGGPSAQGLQHMAVRAQEVRKQFALTSTDPTESGGNNVAGSGQNLPPPTETASDSDHATGLERAIEQLQNNSEKNPQAQGLQQALEMLQRNLDRKATIDTEA